MVKQRMTSTTSARFGISRALFLSLSLSVFMLIAPQTGWAKDSCSGHFVNPITDICWKCLFPLSIGSIPIGSSGLPDTDNPSLPIQICPGNPIPRLGLAIGYWEPFAITDVTRSPYCLVNLGGISLNVGSGKNRGATHSPSSGAQGAFYQVHWYKYPLMVWLNIITSVGCMQGGDYDIGYLSELDPTWDNDQTALLLAPESFLFANPIAQLSCAVDAIAASTVNRPINKMFWCMGAQGSSYPMTGHVSAEYSPFQTSLLVTERLAFKLHRLGLVKDSSGEDTKVCEQSYQAILPKNRYRYQVVNPKADASACHPFGSSTLKWQASKLSPKNKGNFGYLIWRKRNCVFL